MNVSFNSTFSILKKNITNSTASSSTSPFDYVFQVEQVFRRTGLVVYIMFMIILIFSKQMHTRSYLYINHCAIVSSVFCILQFAYLSGNYPSFENKELNAALCSISEIAWIFSHYIRSYSILLIAIQRYIAVFKMNLFRKLNSSLIYLSCPLIIIWIISIIMPVITKFAFRTSPSSIMCLDGYSLNYNDVIGYVVVNNIAMNLIPTVLTLVIYILIIHKLTTFDRKVENTPINSLKDIGHRNSFSSTGNYSKNIEEMRSTSKKNRRFAHQFLLMCFTVIASVFANVIFSLRTVIVNFNIIFYYWRPILRSYLVFVISLIPIITVFYHPSRRIMMIKLRAFINKLK